MNEELKVIISANISDFQSKMGDVKKSINETSESSGKLNKIGTTMKKVGATVAKVSAAAFAAAAAGIVSITKSAVQNYAEYEQLVGGVETLFKDSAKEVQKYASEAFKTAGLSANEYMSTVTSFSASLLQSLGGDTAEAAAYADRAIIDMADNANKMGTSITSIQNAYQGFAKQNYTMLDNLKLGYGGTKAEMERLIADANKLKEANGEMADLSIDSFADITEAIHLVQTEMGITGTTALEAASTIQGSCSMMKAAWHNLVTGLADENADFDKLLGNFIDSVSTFGKNLIPRIEVALNGVVKLIRNLAPKIVETIPSLAKSVLPAAIAAATDIMTSLAQALPDIVNVIVSIIPDIVQGIGEAIPTILQCIFDAITTIIEGLSESLPQILEVIVGLIPQIVQTLISNIPVLLEAAITFLMAIVQAIPQIIPPLIEALPSIITSIIDCLIANIEILVEGAIQLFMGIIEAIPIFIPKLIEALPDIIIAIVEGLIKGIPQIIKAAFELFMGIVKAIPQMIGNLIKALGQIVSTIVTFLYEKISVVFNKIKDTMSEKISMAKDKVVETFEKIKSSITEKITAAKDTLSNILENIKSKFTSIFDKCKNVVKNAIDKIKSFFNFKWELPKIKLPHFSISGKFSLNPPSIPRFSVSWYQKGGIFDNPTLFGFGGRIGGLGENGAEAIVPLEKNLGWLDKLASMLDERMNNGSGRTIVLQVDGKTFAEIAVDSINDLTKQTGSLPLRFA